MKFNIFLISLISFSLISCKPNETVIERTIEKPNDEKLEKLIKVDETMTDEELADSGEQLLTFYTFPLAEKAFKLALLKNPDNLKAQYYTEGFLKIYTVNKGILNRIKPFVRKQGRIKDLEKIIRDIPNTPARKFLLDGTEDISNVTDIQNYFFETQQNWNNFRKWLIKNYDKNLTLNLDPFWLVVNMGVESKHACELIDEETGKAVCNYSNVFQKKLAPVDLMGIRQMAAGMVLFYSFYTSYNMEGLDKLALLDPRSEFDSKQAYQYLVDINPSLGLLRQKNLLKEVISIGSDMVAATKYAIQYQNQLCPKGPSVTRQRAGFLFHDGVCVVEKDTKSGLDLLEKMLAGPTQQALTNRFGVEKTIKVDYLAWFRNPPSDLKSIGPASFDSCGVVNKLYDPTFGGIFVDKNAEEFMIAGDVSTSPYCYAKSKFKVVAPGYTRSSGMENQVVESQLSQSSN
jgi:hypothetical protein